MPYPLQVNPGRLPDGAAIEDYAAQTSVVMGKREARAAVARHLLTVLDARGALDDDLRAGLTAAAAAGPGYRDLESLHTGERAAQRAEHFARTVSNPDNTWGFVGSFDRHPSRAQILQSVIDKLEDFERRTRARAHDHAALFERDGQTASMESRPGAACDAFNDAMQARGSDADLFLQTSGVAARVLGDGRVELVLRLRYPAGSAARSPRAELIAHARRALEARGILDVAVSTFDPNLVDVARDTQTA